MNKQLNCFYASTNIDWKCAPQVNGMRLTNNEWNSYALTFGVARSSFSISAMPKNPVPPVMNTFFPE